MSESPRQLPRIDRTTVIRKGAEVANALVYEMVFAVSLAVIFPLTLRGLGTADYGRYATIYAISGFAITWVYAGAGAATVQLILQRGRRPTSVVRSTLRQVTATALPAGLIGLALTYWVLGSELLVPALIVFGGDLLVAGIAEIFVATTYARLGVAASVRIRSVGPIIRAIGVAALAITGAITIMGLVLVNLVAALAILLVARVVAKRPLRDDDGTADTNRREVLGLSAMYSTSITTNAVQNEGEKFILATTRPAAEVGEYQAAYRVVSVALLPLKAVHVAANQWFLSRDDRRGSQARRSTLLSMCVLVYGAVAAVAVVIGQPIIAWVVGDEFDEAVTIAVWLSAMPLLHGLAEVPQLGLLGLGENRRRMYLGFVTSAIAVITYVSLTPGLGWKGAVIGTYVSEIATIVGGWWLLLRCQRNSDLLRHDGGTTARDDGDEGQDRRGA